MRLGGRRVRRGDGRGVSPAGDGVGADTKAGAHIDASIRRDGWRDTRLRPWKSFHGRGDGSPARKATRLRGCDFAARENRRRADRGEPPRDGETGEDHRGEGLDPRGAEHGRNTGASALPREMSPGDAGGAPAGEGSAPSPSSRPSANNDDAVRGPAPDAATATDPMVAEAEQSALTLLRRELAASRRATERERLVAKRACEQLRRSAQPRRSARRNRDAEARLEALTEGRESAREEAFRREASPSSSRRTTTTTTMRGARRPRRPPPSSSNRRTRPPTRRRRRRRRGRYLSRGASPHREDEERSIPEPSPRPRPSSPAPTPSSTSTRARSPR